MKKLVVILIVCLVATQAFAGGVTYNFKAEHIAKIIEGTCYLYKNVETIPNPAYVDAETTPNEDEIILKYTDAQWTKEVYRRIIIRDTKRGLITKQRDAEQAIGIPDNAVETQ